MTAFKKIAILSMVRNNEVFAAKWIQYYGGQFGFQNVYLFLDGLDQKRPKLSEQINCYQLPHSHYKRSKGDRKRAQILSNFATQLFDSYDVVLATDIDEFLVLDPLLNSNLKDYLSQEFKGSSLSALGIDVGQHPELEQAVNWDQPLLSQRTYAQISDRYTKPVIALKPLQWGSGLHRVKGKNFKIDPHLFLFHFGLVDFDHTQNHIRNSELLKRGWASHFKRRIQLYEVIKTQKPQEADLSFTVIRNYFSEKRKWYAYNKPAVYKGNALIKIPERFKALV
jgi:hypothetical protein